MRVSSRKVKLIGWMLLSCVMVCHAKEPAQPSRTPLTPEQIALLDKAAFQEKFTVKVIQQHTPLVQTYIQHMKTDPQLGDVPVSDEYLLGRVDFGGTFVDELYEKRAKKKGMFSGSKQFLGKLTSMFKLQISPNGFMDMMFIDTANFDRQHYDFTFVRKEFLGEIKTSVFDVQPQAHMGRGRFLGRVWIDDEGGNIVRFTGTFSSSDRGEVYFHFDSWRGNVQPDVWLPIAVYVQDQDFRGQTQFWGYGLKLPVAGSGDNENVVVDNASDVSDNGQDVSPLQAQRQWENQTEQNVLERLISAGLLANVSEFDQVLETVTNNLIIGNKLDLANPIHCRVMLTSTLESLAIGNTIILSKGLVDVLPDEASLAAVLSFQLAHIVLGHPINTRYAFNDRLLFPDESTLERIAMSHTATENHEAATKALELFKSSIYKDKSDSVGLFLQQLTNSEHQVPALLTTRLGDSMLRPDGQPWLADLSKGAPPLKVTDLQQIAALPLGSHLRVDSWSDKVFQLQVKPQPILSASDKMPFQITPIFFRPARYRVPNSEPAHDNNVSTTPSVQ